MNATVRRWRKPKDTGVNMNRAVFVSLFFHIAVFVAASLSFTFWPSDPPEMGETVMTVDVMDFADMPTTPVNDVPNVTESKESAPPPPKKPVYNTSSSIPDLLTPQEPELSDVPMPDAEKPDEPAIKKPPKPKNKPKRKPKSKPQIQEPEPQKEPKEEDTPQIDSLLRSVLNEDDSNKSEQSEDMPDSEGQISHIAQISAQLLTSMEASLNNGVKRCWNVDAGGRFAETLKVKLQVYVRRDRTVEKIDFVEQARYNTDPHYKAAADAARRALLNRNCWPLDLPEDRYDVWRRFTYTFDPSGML